MEAQWLADRTTLRTLLRTHPDWSVRDFAEAIGRSRGWVKSGESACTLPRLTMMPPFAAGHAVASILHRRSTSR